MLLKKQLLTCIFRKNEKIDENKLILQKITFQRLLILRNL